MRIAFLDRDGTLVPEQPDDVWSTLDRLDLIPGTTEALKSLQLLGYELILITNQYPIGEGVLTQSRYDELAQGLLDVFTDNGIDVLDVFYCPHARGDGCDCIKPRPGLIQRALEKYPATELERSILIGDSDSDMELAIHFGMKAFALPGSAQAVIHPLVNRVETLSDVLPQLATTTNDSPDQMTHPLQ